MNSNVNTDNHMIVDIMKDMNTNTTINTSTNTNTNLRRSTTKTELVFVQSKAERNKRAARDQQESNRRAAGVTGDQA